MKVSIFAPPFCDHSKVEKGGHITLKDGARLWDLYKILKVPAVFRALLITSVNCDKAGLSTKLSDGDEVSIFWPISGG